MNKKISIGVAISLIIVAIALSVAVTNKISLRYYNKNLKNLTDMQNLLEYVTLVDKEVRSKYYGEIKEQELRNALARGYVSGIGDPYAAFMTAQEHQKETERLDGNATAFGIKPSLRSDGDIIATNVQKGSPAANVGVAKGDKIISIDDVKASANTFEEIKNLLNTQQEIKLSFTRDGKKDVTVKIKTASYAVSSVEGRVSGNTGYVKINGFFNNTPEQFEKIVNDLLQQEVSGFVFDVRNNTGGTTEAVEELVGMLIPSGVFAQVVDKDNFSEDLKSTGKIGLSVPCSVLVNKKTQGEAELFALTLKKFLNAKIVGEKTAGRSMVQESFAVYSDGSVVRLSVAKYKIIDQDDIEGVGITPDVVELLTQEQQKEFDFLTDLQDSQIQAAKNALVKPTTPVPDISANSTGSATGYTNNTDTQS